MASRAGVLGVGIVAAALEAGGCGVESPYSSGEGDPPAARSSALVAAAADPSPTVSFTQSALAAGLNRAIEPPSAAAYATPSFGTLSYGTWLADFDGDSLLDVYDVNHGQGPHLSGLWLNKGAGAFGPNLYTLAVQPASTKGASLALSNQIMYVGDVSGDGRVDIYFLDWSGLGALCINTGAAAHADWTGPSFDCYTAYKPRAFGDVNGDGKIDVQVVDPSVPYDVYKDYCRTLPTSWRLNNGDPNFNAWPSDSNDFHFVGKAAPGVLLDLNKDGYPDKLQGTELPSGQRGPFGLASGGLVLSLGQANGTYVTVTSGLEAVTQPPVRIEDVDEDGCLDVGVDRTGYRDNQYWYVQDRSGTSCLAKFHFVERTTMAYHPGSRHYDLDVDNDGLIDKASLIHNAYGNNDGKTPGVHLYRRLPGGGFTDLGAAGININGTSSSEFYADQLSPGDWNNDGKVDLAGNGQPSIPGTDAGIALWTSNLSTTNKWLKVRLPSVSGFFTGSATIELFDAGFAGDPSHAVTPPKVLRTGAAWASQVYHFGIGTRASVDLRVTFPDGRQTVQTGVAPNTTVSVAATANAAPSAVAKASPTSAGVGQAIAFDGTASSDPDGTIAAYTWTFGDGTSATGATATHAYAAPGSYMATLTVRDNGGTTATAVVGVSVSDVVAPTLSIDRVTITPSVSDDGGVASVTWSVDGTDQPPVTAAPFGLTLSWSALSTGPHVFTARASDRAGNTSTPASIRLTK